MGTALAISTYVLIDIRKRGEDDLREEREGVLRLPLDGDPGSLGHGT